VKPKDLVGLQHQKLVKKISQTRCLMRCDISNWDTLRHFKFKKFSLLRPRRETKHYHDLRVPCSRSLFPQHSTQRTSCSLFLFPQEFGEHPTLSNSFIANWTFLRLSLAARKPWLASHPPDDRLTPWIMQKYCKGGSPRHAPSELVPQALSYGALQILMFQDWYVHSDRNVWPLQIFFIVKL